MSNNSMHLGDSQSVTGSRDRATATRDPARAGGATAQGHGGGVRRGDSGGDGLPPTSNTRGSNFANGIKCLYRALDWVSLSVQINRAELVELLGWIGPAVGSEVTRGEVSMLVKAGGGAHPYILRLGGGLSIKLPGFESSSDRVVIWGTSEWCAVRDHGGTDAELARVLLDVLGLDVTGRKVSATRIDMASDFLMLEADAVEFFGLARSDAVVTRARDRSAFQRGKRWTGSKFGREAVVLRLYDKLTDAKQKHTLERWLQLWKLDAVPDGHVVVRVEWQLRGPWLRDRGIGSITDLLAAAANILGYLNADWFRLAGVPGGHLHKRETLSVWASIAALMAAGPFSGAVGGAKVVRPVSVDVGAAMAQAAGVLAWLGSCLAHDADDGVIPDLGEVAEYVRRRVDRDWWSGRVSQRMVAARYGAAA